MDNISVQVVPPAATVTKTDDFSAAGGPMFNGASTGTWSVGVGRLTAAPGSGSDTAINLVKLGDVTQLKTASLLDFSTTLKTSSRAGIVFDRYSDTDFKWAAIDTVTKQVLIGHRTAGGWFVDAAVSNIGLNATTDFTLGIVVRGSSVSATLNGQAAVGFVFNAVGVDGRFGLFSRGPGASFDAVTVKTNDPAVPATQQAGATAMSAPSVNVLTAEQARAVSAEAVRRWSLVEDASFVSRLGGIELQVADLAGEQLAEYANGRITLDIDAAGHGWFVDPTPRDNAEFAGRGAVMTAVPGSAAAGRMDLLSVLAHEMGHALGLGHVDNGVMAETLLAGTRATPDRWYAAQQAPVAASGRAAAPAAPMVIDWGATPYVAASRSAAEYVASPIAPAAAVADWRQRFVNGLGRANDAANPNASLRLVVPVLPAASIAASSRLTSL